MKEAMEKNVKYKIEEKKKKKRKERERDEEGKTKKTTQSWGKSGERSGGAVRVSHDRRTQYVLCTGGYGGI